MPFWQPAQQELCPTATHDVVQRVHVRDPDDVVVLDPVVLGPGVLVLCRVVVPTVVLDLRQVLVRVVQSRDSRDVVGHGRDEDGVLARGGGRGGQGGNRDRKEDR